MIQCGDYRTEETWYCSFIFFLFSKVSLGFPQLSVADSWLIESNSQTHSALEEYKWLYTTVWVIFPIMSWQETFQTTIKTVYYKDALGQIEIIACPLLLHIKRSGIIFSWAEVTFSVRTQFMLLFHAQWWVCIFIEISFQVFINVTHRVWLQGVI